MTCFHGCYSVGDGRLWGVDRRREGAVKSLAALWSIRAARPDGAPIHVVMDGLSVHTGVRLRTWAGRHQVELCFTPTNASWADLIEAHFGPVRQFILANSNHPDHTVQTRDLHACLRWRNAHADRIWDERMCGLIRPDVLILDGFAVLQVTAARADDLYELVSERQGWSLIITSNRAPSGWYPLFRNPVVAGSLLDRLINTSHQVVVNGPGYRPSKRPRNSTEKNRKGTATDS